MTHAPLVSVIIPSFERNDTLREALDSVLAQTYPSLQILVIDDNHDPHWSARLRTIVAPYGERVTLLANARRKGACGARNTGIDACAGKYIAFLDDDDRWYPQKIARQVEQLSQGDCQAVFCDFVRVDAALGNVAARRSPSRITHAMMRDGECPASTSLVVVRRALLVAVGGFDEALPSFQDFDLWLRVTEHTDLHRTPQVLAEFVQHRGPRVSVNLDRRRQALAVLATKWSGSGDDQRRWQALSTRYLAAAHVANGKTLIGRHYRDALRWIWQGVRIGGRRDNAWYWLAIAALGPIGPWVSRAVLRRRHQRLMAEP